MERDKGQNDKPDVRKSEISNPLNVFSTSPHFLYVYKKTEKIVTALYMVTGFLSDKEPLKWKIRELGAELLSLVNKIKDKFSTQQDELVFSIHSVCLEVSSLLDVARFSGLMSEMNALILKDELGILSSILSENRDFESSAKNLTLDKSFFDEIPPLASPSRQGSWKYLAKSIKDIKDSNNKSNKGQNINQVPSPVRVSASSHEKREKRRKIILDLIKRKGNITIRDVSAVIADWSDKTIQRELLSLVAEGTLKKEGERRWSRYSLLEA